MKYKIILLLVSLCMLVPAYAAESASQILDKAVSNINKKSNLSCSFTISGDGTALSGKLVLAKNKFKITTPAASTWYDGTTMWTANNSSKEITVVNPTVQEVNETNPFSYLYSYKTDYKVYFSKRKNNSSYLVLLNPKKRNSEIKAIEIALNKKTLTPEHFIIRDRNDKIISVTISSLTFNNSIKPSIFTCPVKSMTGFEVVDLR